MSLMIATPERLGGPESALNERPQSARQCHCVLERPEVPEAIANACRPPHFAEFTPGKVPTAKIRQPGEQAQELTSTEIPASCSRHEIDCWGIDRKGEYPFRSG